MHEPTTTELGPRLGDKPLDTLHHILRLKPQGHATEFGVYKGRTLRIIAQHMPTTGFDTFTGLPENWRPGFNKGHFACTPPNIPNTQLIIGPFTDTLPNWTPPQPIGLTHIDCDLYTSTKTILKHIWPHLHPNAYIIFDEYHGYPDADQHEARAWHEHQTQHHPTYQVIGHGPQQWAIQLM